MPAVSRRPNSMVSNLVTPPVSEAVLGSGSVPRRGHTASRSVQELRVHPTAVNHSSLRWPDAGGFCTAVPAGLDRAPRGCSPAFRSWRHVGVLFTIRLPSLVKVTAESRVDQAGVMVGAAQSGAFLTATFSAVHILLLAVPAVGLSVTLLRALSVVVNTDSTIGWAGRSSVSGAPCPPAVQDLTPCAQENAIRRMTMASRNVQKFAIRRRADAVLKDRRRLERSDSSLHRDYEFGLLGVQDGGEGDDFVAPPTDQSPRTKRELQ